MANRALAAKHERAKRERRELVHREYSKSAWLAPDYVHTIALDKVTHFNGKAVTVAAKRVTKRTTHEQISERQHWDAIPSNAAWVAAEPGLITANSYRRK